MSTNAAAYERRKKVARARFMEMSIEGRDIGAVPKVASPRRRSRCKLDFERFCLTYLAQTFCLPFCGDHKRVISKIRTVVLEGGQFALAMPRASGKTSLCEAATLWAILYAHRRFVALIGSDLSSAIEMMDSMKVELEANELLLEDFPEVCFPIRALDRIAHRCRGQTSGGEPTRIGWLADSLVLPTIRKSKASGSVIRVAGLDGRIRGMKHKLADGGSIRPDLALVDDPQTDGSARSLSQCEQRARILQGAVLGLAGPRRKIACLMPCTVIQPGDLADRFLTPGRHSDWHGERTRMLYGEPADPKLWDEYANLRAEKGQAAATAFYAANQTALDAGLTAAWPERFEPGQASAVQHAMDLKIDKPEIFAAEYQNEPRPPEEDSANALDAAEVAQRLSRLPRGVAPAGFARLTCGIDVQQDLIYWAVCAWRDDFTGTVIDYGAWPEQPRGYFTLREANPTLARVTGVSSVEGAVHAGLEKVAGLVLGREWPVDGGGGLRVSKCLVDANWGQVTETVYAWCRQSACSAVVTPSHGKYIGPDGSPMGEWAKRPPERSGLNWKYRPPKHGRASWYVLYDSNFWKTFTAARLLMAQGERGAMTLFGQKPSEHRLFCDHLTAERPERSKKGREVDEWKMRVEHRDNHFWDTLVMSTVAASVAGCLLAESMAKPVQKKRKVSWSDFAKAGR